MRRYLIEALGALGTDVPHRVWVTDRGFDEYACTFLPGYGGLKRAVGLEIENHQLRRSDEIARAIDAPQVIVDHILSLLEARGWVGIRQETTPWTEITSVSPELEYWLEETD